MSLPTEKHERFYSWSPFTLHKPINTSVLIIVNVLNHRIKSNIANKKSHKLTSFTKMVTCLVSYIAFERILTNLIIFAR